MVRYAVAVADAGAATVRVRLRDAEGAEVASARRAPTGALRVAATRALGPGARLPLRAARSSWSTDDAVVDSYMLPVGIRTVRVEGTQFLINGEPFYFRGFGKHEDLNVHGRGHDDAAMVHDFSLLSWIGANSFRTSHYPYAEEVLEQADREGIVVIDETAAVGLNLGVGGGLFLGGPKTTYSEETISSATQLVHRQAIEELIARDKNHPCVVLWSLANEPESHTEAARAYFAPLFEAARSADPSRPVGFVNMMFALPDTCTVTALADVVMINRYYGWYVEPGDLHAAERGLEAELQAWADAARQAHHRDGIRGRHHVRPALDGGRASGARSTRWRSSRPITASSTAPRRSSASTSGTSPTSPPGRRSCASTATRRACSPATGGPKWPHMTCDGAGVDAT